MRNITIVTEANKSYILKKIVDAKRNKIEEVKDKSLAEIYAMSLPRLVNLHNKISDVKYKLEK